MGSLFQNRIHYRSQRSWGKVMFLHVCVILFTVGVGGGGAIPACIAGVIPTCLAAGLQGGSAHGGSAPRGVCPQGVPGGDPPGRLLLRTVRILLECILVLVFFPNEKIFVQLDELDESERITQAYK